MAHPLKTAVVTGTARPHGIGRATARAFVRAGYQVLGVDKLKLQDADKDEALLGSRYAHVVLDISAPQEVGFVPHACKQHFGSQDIHVLVNNAGIADPHMPSRAESAAMISHWRAVIDTNLTGAFLMSQAVLPHMPAGDAAIIHVSSTRAHQSEPHTEAYAAAKAGLLGLAHAQAISLAQKVRVNTVLPGWIDTSGDPGSITAADHAWHPSGRVGIPEDVAELCLFLADSSKAGFITGQEFVIDGGVSKKMVYPEEVEGEEQQQHQQPQAVHVEAAEGATAAALDSYQHVQAGQQQAGEGEQQQQQGQQQVERDGYSSDDRPPIVWPE